MIRKFRERRPTEVAIEPNPAAEKPVVPVDPSTEPVIFGTFVPTHTPGLYFADDDDEDGQLFEANLFGGVLIANEDVRRAELALADFFANAASILQAERLGHADRAASRADAPPELFVSRSHLYSMRAYELREKHCDVRREAYDADPQVRLASARDPYATTAQLELLARDGDAAVRRAAMIASLNTLC